MVTISQISDVLGDLADCTHGPEKFWTVSRNGFTYCTLCEVNKLNSMVINLEAEIHTLKLILSENDIHIEQ